MIIINKFLRNNPSFLAMKSSAIFCFALFVTCALSVGLKSSAEMQFNSQLKQLQKTGWGRVAVGLLDLQLQTGGPIDELITAFKNLVRDLRFKIKTEQEDYQIALAEHNAIEDEIQFRIRDAQVRIGVATSHLFNTLYPARESYETAIANDEQLIADTQVAWNKATHEREQSHNLYLLQVEEIELAIEAVKECMGLIEGLLNPEAGLIEIRKAKNHIKKLTKQLSGMGKFSHIIKALAALSQEYASGAATKKVFALFEDLLDSLHETLADTHHQEELQLGAYNALVQLYTETIAEAEARIVENTFLLEETNGFIGIQETNLAEAQADLEVAEADLAAETERWDHETEVYLDLMAEFDAESAAIDACIDIFASADMGNISGGLADKMNQ